MALELQEKAYMACHSLLLLLPAMLSCAASSVRGGDPTAGFTAVELTEEQFEVQRPYDVPAGQRYRFAGGVRQLRVYDTDKPHTPVSRTKPRTEIRINHTYSSGVWQFQGHGYVPAGTTGVCVMQVFGAAADASTLMLRVYDGKLMYYRDAAMVADGDIYDRWFRLNVVHDVEASTLAVFVDGVLRLTAPGRGGGAHYFKFGVYTQNDPSPCMESRWKDVKILTKK